MSTAQTPEPAETAAVREGADVEVTSADPSGGVPQVQLDEETLQAAARRYRAGTCSPTSWCGP